jgi:hypothetical protein
MILLILIVFPLLNSSITCDSRVCFSSCFFLSGLGSLCAISVRLPFILPFTSAAAAMSTPPLHPWRYPVQPGKPKRHRGPRSQQVREQRAAAQEVLRQQRSINAEPPVAPPLVVPSLVSVHTCPSTPPPSISAASAADVPPPSISAASAADADSAAQAAVLSPSRCAAAAASEIGIKVDSPPSPRVFKSEDVPLERLTSPKNATHLSYCASVVTTPCALDAPSASSARLKSQSPSPIREPTEADCGVVKKLRSEGPKTCASREFLSMAAKDQWRVIQFIEIFDEAP